MQLKLTPQAKSNWCWAAVAASIARYYYPGHNHKPLDVVRHLIDLDKCCGGIGTQCKVCNKNWQITDALRFFKINFVTHPGRCDYRKLCEELDAGFPIVAVIRWRDGQHHFVLITDHKENGRLLIQDPKSGDHVLPLQQFTFFYLGEGAWVGSFFTRPQNV